MLLAGLFATTAMADEAKNSPRDKFVAYFRAMDARQDDIVQALKAPECSDSLHMNIDKLNIVDRLQPFYELSTTNRALVVAQPFTILSTVVDRDEVRKHWSSWRRNTLAEPDSAQPAIEPADTAFDDEDQWEVHPIRDTSDRKRLSRSCNHVLAETKSAQEWRRFPRGALAIGGMDLVTS